MLNFWRFLERGSWYQQQFVKLHLSFVWSWLHLLYCHYCPPVTCMQPNSVGILACFSYKIWTRHAWSSCPWSPTEAMVLLWHLKGIWSQAQLPPVTNLNNHEEAFLLQMPCSWLPPCNMKELYSFWFHDNVEELHYCPFYNSAFCQSFNILESWGSSGQVLSNLCHTFYIKNHYNLLPPSCFFCLWFTFLLAFGWEI